MTGSFTSVTDGLTFAGTSTFRQIQAAGGTQAFGDLSFLGGDGGFTTVKGTANTFTTFTSLAARAEGAVGVFANTAVLTGAQTGATTITGQAGGEMGPAYFFSSTGAGATGYASTIRPRPRKRCGASSMART